jgi:hypothetical protein
MVMTVRLDNTINCVINKKVYYQQMSIVNGTYTMQCTVYLQLTKLEADAAYIP